MYVHYYYYYRRGEKSGRRKKKLLPLLSVTKKKEAKQNSTIIFEYGQSVNNIYGTIIKHTVYDRNKGKASNSKATTSCLSTTSCHYFIIFSNAFNVRSVLLYYC